MERIFKRTQEPVGMQAGKSAFVGAHGTPYHFTNDDHHLGLGAALGGFSTVQRQNIEPRIAESLDATVLRVTMAIRFADMKTSGGMFHPGSSVKTITMPGGGIRTEGYYEAITHPDAFQSAITGYGGAPETALMSLVRPALSGAATQ